MIRKMIIPIIKRYKGMFISMVIVSALAVAMLTGLTSIVQNTYNAYLNFKEEYGTADFTLNTDLASKNTLTSINKIDGVKEVNARLALPAYLTNNDRISTAMICTFNENDFSKHYVISVADDKEEEINLTLEKRYAENNNLKAGDSVDMYFYGTKTKCYVKEIVYTPETIYVLANRFMKPDNTGFGYIFLSDSDYAKVIKEVSKNNIEIAIEDIMNGLVRQGVSRYANQVLVKCEEGADVEAVMSACKEELSSRVKVSDATAFEDSPTAEYMLKFSTTFEKAAFIIPAFFYLIMIVISIIFLNQIVLYLTRDIGTMLAIGIEKKDIVKLMSMISLCISAGSLIVGYAIGKVLSIIGAKVFGEIYQLPKISIRLNILLIALAVLITAIIGQIATLASTGRIFKITPKDAMLDNVTGKENIPKFLRKGLKNAKTNTALNTSIIFHNPRRIVASIFCILAATAVMTLAITFETAEDISIKQATDKAYAFDIHYLCNGKDNQKTFNDLSNLEGVEKIEKIYYKEMKIESETSEIEMNVCGMIKDCSLYKIPDEKGDLGNVKVEGDGIWLNKDYADWLGVGVGDNVTINGTQIKVVGLTYQFLEKMSAMSDEQMKNLTDDYQVGYMMNVSSRSALDEYVLVQDEACVIDEIEDIKTDLNLRMSAANLMFTIIIIFAILMSVIIIAMMTLASLLEQKRMLSTMRILGFSLKDISGMWLKQEIIFFVIGSVLGFPLGLIAQKGMNKMLINDSWSFPFTCTVWDVLIVIGIIVVTLAIVHFLMVKQIQKWNLADNMRTKE